MLPRLSETDRAGFWEPTVRMMVRPAPDGMELPNVKVAVGGVCSPAKKATADWTRLMAIACLAMAQFMMNALNMPALTWTVLPAALLENCAHKLTY